MMVIFIVVMSQTLNQKTDNHGSNGATNLDNKINSVSKSSRYHTANANNNGTSDNDLQLYSI